MEPGTYPTIEDAVGNTPLVAFLCIGGVVRDRGDRNLSTGVFPA